MKFFFSSLKVKVVPLNKISSSDPKCDYVVRKGQLIGVDRISSKFDYLQCSKTDTYIHRLIPKKLHTNEKFWNKQIFRNRLQVLKNNKSNIFHQIITLLRRSHH